MAGILHQDGVANIKDSYIVAKAVSSTQDVDQGAVLEEAQDMISETGTKWDDSVCNQGVTRNFSWMDW